MENKTSKYFKYAVGEIILVVIGILIALQINNWNETRKSDAFEIEMLTQIRANLIKDKLTLENILLNNNKAIISTQKILKLKPTEIENDSIKFWLSDIIQFDRFQSLTNAYEVLKSKGLDQIRNKQLGFLLGTYYDDKAAHIQEAINDIKFTFVNDWIPLLKKSIVEFKFKNKLILNDYHNFITPGETQNILKLNIDNFGGSSTYITEGIVQINEIMSLIKEELN